MQIFKNKDQCFSELLRFIQTQSSDSIISTEDLINNFLLWLCGKHPEISKQVVSSMNGNQTSCLKWPVFSCFRKHMPIAPTLQDSPLIKLEKLFKEEILDTTRLNDIITNLIENHKMPITDDSYDEMINEFSTALTIMDYQLKEYLKKDRMTTQSIKRQISKIKTKIIHEYSKYSEIPHHLDKGIIDKKLKICIKFVALMDDIDRALLKQDTEKLTKELHEDPKVLIRNQLEKLNAHLVKH